jgi:hypothetical protein
LERRERKNERDTEKEEMGREITIGRTKESNEKRNLEKEGEWDDDQWRYSPDWALASLTGFMIVYSTM